MSSSVLPRRRLGAGSLGPAAELLAPGSAGVLEAGFGALAKTPIPGAAEDDEALAGLAPNSVDCPSLSGA